jgi:ABC-type uncharacterized transport system permease subunit
VYAGAPVSIEGVYQLVLPLVVVALKWFEMEPSDDWAVLGIDDLRASVVARSRHSALEIAVVYSTYGELLEVLAHLS